MTLKEIAAIAMDEADLYEATQDELGESEVAEDAKKNFYKAQIKMGKKGASTAPASANPMKPKDPASTGPTEIKENKEAKHARDYPGSFGNPECYSKNKDGCPRHQTGIYADKGSQYAKLDASGQQVFATEEQRKNAKPDDEQDKLEDSTEKKPAPAAETEKVVEEVKVVLSDPQATQEKKAEAEQKVVSTLAPTEQGAVSTLNALAENGNGDKVIEAMEKVSANAVATENDKVAAAFIAETALETMKKQNASAEAVQTAEQKVQAIKDAANAAGAEKAQSPAQQNGTLRERPSAEMQKKLADAVKNSFGKLYDDFVEDVRNVADGQCFAAGDDESEDHYFVKKDGKIYRADANDQPVGDALSEEEVMCAMIGEGHLWVDGKRTAGGEAPQQQAPAPAPAPSLSPSPAPAPAAQSPAPAPQGVGTPAPAQPQMPATPEDMAKMIAEQENQLKEAAKAKATQEMNADWQKAMAETDPQKRLEAMKAVQAKYASALAAIDNPAPQAQAPAQPAQNAAPTAPSPAPAPQGAEPPAPAEAQPPTLAGTDEKALEGLSPNTRVSIPDDTGASPQVAKASDGNFYRLDENGKATGDPMSAAEASKFIQDNADTHPASQSVADHFKHCKANPKSRCPFLRAHLSELDEASRKEVEGAAAEPREGNAPAAPSPENADGGAALSSALSDAVSKGTIDNARASAISSSLTSETTGLRDPEDLNALHEKVAELTSGMEEADAKSVSGRLAEMVKGGYITKEDISDPQKRESAVMEAAEWKGDLVNGFPSMQYGDMKYVLVNGPDDYDKVPGDYGIIHKGNQAWDKMLEANAQANERAEKVNAAQEDNRRRVNEILAQDNLKPEHRQAIAALAEAIEDGDSLAKQSAARSRVEKIVKEEDLDRGRDSDSQHQMGKPSSVSAYDHVDWDVDAEDLSSLGMNKVEGKRDDVPVLETRINQKLTANGFPQGLPITTSTDQNRTTMTISLPDVIVNSKGKRLNLDNAVKKFLSDMQTGGANFKQLSVSYDKGRNAVTVQYENTVKGSTEFGAIVDSKEFREASKKTPGTFTPGVDVETGKPIITNLEEMTHMLIGGKTGMGKTSNIGNILTSLCVGTSPNDLELIGIDPKGNGLPWMKAFPHTKDVVTDMDQAGDMLKWLRNEMATRNKLFAAANVDNLEQYNAKAAAGQLPADFPKHLKYIVPVIDEASDLMRTHGKAVQSLLESLSGVGRSSGIRMIVATQKPDAKTIPTTITSNLPTVMGLGTKSAIESRQIMGSNDHKLEDIKEKGRYIMKIGEKEFTGQGSYLSAEKLSEIGSKLADKWNKVTAAQTSANEVIAPPQTSSANPSAS